MHVLCNSIILKMLRTTSFMFSNRSLLMMRKLSVLMPKSVAFVELSNETNATSLRLGNLLHTSASSHTFWESDRKSGYPSTVEMPTKTQLIRDGIKELKNEIKLWKEEVKEKLECDPILVYRPGEVDICWQFGSPGALSHWVTSSDSDHNQGYSTCELMIGSGGKGLFQGNLCVEVPKDGKVKRAGYCNMRSKRARKSFKRDSYHDWRMYTHLVMRVRGDGRPYIINISTEGYFDLFWNDIYSYALYTRGGPYWQVTKIPFSKFFLSSKGRLQDKQAPIALDKVTHFGFSLGDKVNGPFRLEIDYIGVEFDPGHTEEFAYEMYRTPKYVAAT